MAVAQIPKLDRRLCSVFSKTRGEDPGGTAPSWRRCLLVELARPWATEVQETAHFPAEVSDVLAEAERQGSPVKLHCIAPDREHSTGGHTRVLLFSRPEGRSAAFDKEDYVVPSDRAGALANALVAGRGRLAEFDGFRQETSGVREILVCTQANYDRCCGTFGYPTYEALRERYAPKAGGLLRVWQTSHLGGHRFAPNVIDLPQGLNWVRMGVDELDALVHRDRPASDLRGHYRGRLGLETLFEQLAERELLVQEGWDWTALPVSGRVLDISDDGRQAEVRIEYSGRDGVAGGAYEATVVQTGTAPRAGCPDGEPDGEAAQFAVRRLTRATP